MRIILILIMSSTIGSSQAFELKPDPSPYKQNDAGISECVNINFRLGDLHAFAEHEITKREVDRGGNLEYDAARIKRTEIFRIARDYQYELTQIIHKGDVSACATIYRQGEAAIIRKLCSILGREPECVIK